jgi:hypothetical protein
MLLYNTVVQLVIIDIELSFSILITEVELDDVVIVVVLLFAVMTTQTVVVLIDVVA